MADQDLENEAAKPSDQAGNTRVVVAESPAELPVDNPGGVVAYSREGGILDSKTRSDIDLSIESLKQTLLRNLEQIVQSTSRKVLEPSAMAARQTDVGNFSQGPELGFETRNSPTFNEPSLMRELASSYLKERQNILRTVLSSIKIEDRPEETRDDGERQVSLQRQMKVWTDIATDLDGYYLELLNRFLRIGRMKEGDMKDGALITCRMSGNIVDNLAASGRTHMYRSQENVNDDVICEQFQEPFHNRTAEGIIENLLLRTNDGRKKTIGFFEAADDKEAADVSAKVVNLAGSECGWSEGSEGRDESLADAEEWGLRRVTSQREKDLSLQVNCFEAYVKEQNKELESRKTTINQLMQDNYKLMRALETFEEFKKSKEKEDDEKMKGFRRDNQNELNEKTSEVVIVRDLHGEHEKSLSEKKKNGVRYDHGEVRESKILFDERMSFADEQELISYFCEWIPERLLQLCERCQCAGVHSRDREDKSAHSIMRYVDDLFVRLLESATRNNDTISKLEWRAKALNRDAQKLRSKYVQVKSKLEAAVSQKDDLEMQITEKDNFILTQGEILCQYEKEINDAQSQRDLLREELGAALEKLDAERQQTELLEEEVKQSVLLEMTTSQGNEKRLEMLTANSIFASPLLNAENGSPDKGDAYVRRGGVEMPFE